MLRRPPAIAQSRFTYEAPGLWRMLWELLYADWRERCRPWITDHARGTRFRLTAEEDAMMAAVAERIHAATDRAGLSIWQARKFWTPARIDAVRDHALKAISDRRHGDDSGWNALVAELSRSGPES